VSVAWLCVERRAHLLAKHLIDASADLFVSQKLSTVELPQASCHLLAEPCVMIDVVFHKLLHVFFRAALVLGSGPLHFRLQLRRSALPYFPRLGLHRAAVKA
jgi:hypothetical protein